jgi:hypothetical protein
MLDGKERSGRGSFTALLLRDNYVFKK